MDFTYDGEDGHSSSHESDMEWEEVVDPQAGTSADGARLTTDNARVAAASGAGIEVTLKPGSKLAASIVTQGGKAKGKGKRPAGFSAAAAEERARRTDLHKVHTSCLLASGFVRNGLLNDRTLQARLLSKTPLKHQNRFFEYNKATHPNANDRSRLFETAMRHLTVWWHDQFHIEDGAAEAPTAANLLLSLLGGPHGLESLDYHDLQALLAEITVEQRVLLMMPFAEEEALSELATMLEKKREELSGDVKGKSTAPAKKPKKRKLAKALSTELGELIRNSQSLAKRAVRMSGSADMSAQLFTCLCRALDVPARLVCSMPVVDYRSSHKVKRDEGIADLRTGGKGRGRKAAANGAATATEDDHTEGTMSGTDKTNGNDDDDDDDAEFEEVEIPSKGSRPRGRPPKNIKVNGHTSDASIKSRSQSKPVPPPRSGVAALFANRVARRRAVTHDPEDAPTDVPAFWTEVYNRSLQEWITVDPVRNKLRPRKGEFDNGHLFYVAAFEVDQYIKDVTPRYAKSFAGRTLKMRPQGRKKDDPDWWDDLLRPWQRPFVLGRELKEDEELIRQQNSEPMPTVLEGFKNHPRFVLARHLKREEVVPASTRQLGLFRGDPVYPRAAVLSVKAAEAWMREGMAVKEGEQPLKNVKQRAVTINKRRIQELALQEGQEPIMQGLYSRSQTEPIIPPPIVNGVIPKNSYGNLDLFAPHMLPAGAAHIPFKNARKAAKELEIDFAEAVTGFEFHKRRAIPVISGIVVAAENEEVVLQAHWAAESAAAEKEIVKRRERCLKRWKKLIIGLRVRSRIQGEYKGKSPSKASASTKAEAPSEGVSQLQALNNDAEDTKPASTETPGEFINVNSLHPSEPGGAAFPRMPQPPSMPASLELPPMPAPNLTSAIDLPDLKPNIDDLMISLPNVGDQVALDDFTLQDPEQFAMQHGPADENDAAPSPRRPRKRKRTLPSESESEVSSASSSEADDLEFDQVEPEATSEGDDQVEAPRSSSASQLSPIEIDDSESNEEEAEPSKATSPTSIISEDFAVQDARAAPAKSTATKINGDAAAPVAARTRGAGRPQRAATLQNGVSSESASKRPTRAAAARTRRALRSNAGGAGSDDD